MRKFIITAATTAALTMIACGGAAYAVLDQSHFAAYPTSIQHLSVHVNHDGRPMRPGHSSLFAS